MSIGIVTLHTSEIECYSKYTLPIFQKYCLAHNYTLIIGERCSDRAPTWDKILLLKKYHKLFDYLFWLDADMVINKLEHKLEDIIEQLEKPIGVCENGTKYREFNCGSIVVKNDKKVEKFLNIWWGLGQNWGLENRIAHEQQVLNRIAFVNKTQKQRWNLDMNVANMYGELLQKLPCNLMNNAHKIYPEKNFVHHMLCEHMTDKIRIAKQKYDEIV